jgi:hypothetical protein
MTDRLAFVIEDVYKIFEPQIVKALFQFTKDRLCGLVVRVPGLRSRDSGSILGATRFSEK